jgi:hypothetical protein
MSLSYVQAGFFATAIAAALLLAASRAHASDGVLEINQACAATGCFAGDPPGFPVTITASGSYRLTSNLVHPTATTNAIETSAENVSIDLGGFAIEGPNTCTGEPVTSCSSAASGTGIVVGERGRIFGGSITGMGNGISCGRDTRISDVTVSENVNGGISTARGTSIHDSSVIANGGIGIRANSGGGYVEVKGSTIRGNGQEGLVVTDGLVLENRIQNNGLSGISAGGDGAIGLNHVDGNNGGGTQVSGTEAIACNLVGGGYVCPP